MATFFQPPLSGAVLVVLVDVLELRRWAPQGTLNTRNARRYFAGERVSPSAKAAVHRAVAKALVASDLVPATLTLADLLPVAPPELPELPPFVIVLGMMARYIATWDALSGALRRSTAPIAFPNHAAGACLRLVAVDVALRISALLWLTRNPDEWPVLAFWTTPNGVGSWLRTKVEAAGMTRDAMAGSLNVASNTLDGWLDNDVKPSFENIDDLAQVLARSGDEDHADLRRRLRLVFAAREIFRRVEAVVGPAQAFGICQRIAVYSNEMVRFPRTSTAPMEDNDMKMRIALTAGTLGAEAKGAKWICSMVDHLWKCEDDPVWRTTLRAATRSWFEHLQTITAKLGPIDMGGLTTILGRAPSREEIDSLTYRMQSSKEEYEHDPVLAAVMRSEMLEDGERGALELKLRACEKADRGDHLAAIDMLEAAVSKDPTNAETHFRLGCELWQVGEVKAGLGELEIAAQLKPSWDRPRVEIAIVLLNEGLDQAAHTRLVAANAACPGTPWVLLHLAYVYERLGDVAKAIRFYEELLALEDHAEALDRVAHLYLVKGDKRSGADRAKRAAQTGVPTVADAHEAGYYKRRGARDRPPHARQLDGYLNFPDSAWRISSAARSKTLPPEE